MTTSITCELVGIIGQTMITDIVSDEGFWHSSPASFTQLNTLRRPGPFLFLHGITHQTLQTLSTKIYRIFPGYRARNRQTDLKLPLHRRPRHARFPLLCDRYASALAFPFITAETISRPRGDVRIGGVSMNQSIDEFDCETKTRCDRLAWSKTILFRQTDEKVSALLHA